MNMKRCYLYNKGTLAKEKVPHTLFGEFIGNFPAEVCNACGEIFFDEKTPTRITAATKAKGLWGIGGRTKIGQAGSTLDIRLPKRIIEFLKLKKGEEVTIYPESKKRLIVEV
jgi:hypothetical protein